MTDIEKILGRIAVALEQHVLTNPHKDPYTAAKYHVCQRCSCALVPEGSVSCPACLSTSWQAKPGEGGFIPGPD